MEMIIVNGIPRTSGSLTPSQAILTQIDPVMLAMILFSWMPYAKSRGACRCEAGYAEAAPTQARRLLHSHRTLVRNDIATDFKKSVPKLMGDSFDNSNCGKIGDWFNP
jgi:hypothetical protein